MPESKFRILLAEDDATLGGLLVDHLESADFDVKLCRDGEKALKEFREQSFDLCLLDVMMPKLDGFTLVSEIRKKDIEIPVLFITARSQREDRLKGYELGADDYISKPFDVDELLYKIKAVLRRTGDKNVDPNGIISLGKFEFHPGNQSLRLNGVEKRMTERENAVLKYLYENRNKVIRRQDLLKDLWGDNDYFFGRSLDVFITKIRKYLKDDPELNIENVFGVGFFFHVK